MDQEQLMHIQMIEQEANQISQQLEIIEQNIGEINELKLSLDELEKDDNKEMLANLGKKIFIPVEIKKKELIVEVGNKNFVKKSIPETKKIIEGQIEKLDALKNQLDGRIADLQSEMQNLALEINSSSKGGHKCDYEDCQCDESCEDCSCEHGCEDCEAESEEED